MVNQKSNSAVEYRECTAAFDLLALHEAHPERYPSLLQSVAAGTAQARFDILFAFPGETLSLQLDGTLHRSDELLADNDFLQQLDCWWQRESSEEKVESSLPFGGGWFLYLGYELAAQVEKGLRLPEQGFATGLPVAFATRIPAAIIRDHQRQQSWLVAEEGDATLLDTMENDIAALSNMVSVKQCDGRLLVTDLKEEEPSCYLSAVEKIKRYIVDGDVFQVNLSRAWQGEMAADVTTSDIYRSLCENNPAPFAGLACYQGYAVISSSPERLVSVSGHDIAVRPIAGTRPRSTEIDDDRALSEALMQHPKERAEHIMLIDLERNDLGRVCKPGSINVDELMVLESYTHVHHIVSNVCGTLRDATSPGDVIRAVFPGGTITGCPKVRCMEIIAELEQTTRGPYTGAMGYLNLNGDMDLNILIRTIVSDGKQVGLRAGAGIVADSIPDAELAETRFKARGLLRALGINDAD